MSSLARFRLPVLALRSLRRQAPQVQQKRHGSLLYRALPVPPRKHYWTGEAIMGLMWFWILWRFYHDPEMVIGHGYPDISKWTDEELGIPPDDEE
ncbi:NADH dehydrogenase [ubiquinone] 1 beta subcomplex subunit 2, mitochondrial-like [Saccoglossus kowalevskii]|uniref:NADH dehydrogenase [ubiquinone] 1 beta subcomplex subunit 2, mitochondrial-like n=1 Tax=Saccoglossus kowalevskii TaxID=10224 RepID=A0ABM0MNK6_SACKO|nr:PREDICTED: NADH dehydrogenase [ubiquinone] 1 beta subcomplex subunit 2, mitochondrial-like [Saccoglossus kowalevskii]